MTCLQNDKKTDLLFFGSGVFVCRRVFCNSMSDVFDNQVPDEWRRDLFALIEATPSLDWLLLTKRPQNIGKQPSILRTANVWLGVTAENQREADRRTASRRR